MDGQEYNDVQEDEARSKTCYTTSEERHQNKSTYSNRHKTKAKMYTYTS